MTGAAALGPGATALPRQRREQEVTTKSQSALLAH